MAKAKVPGAAAKVGATKVLRARLEDRLTRHLDGWLRPIDDGLAAAGTSIKQRPLIAALMLLEHGVVSLEDSQGHPLYVHGQTKGFEGSDWFKALIAAATNWYNDQYGQAMAQETERLARGVALIRGTAFELRVPLVRTTPGTPGETVWIAFLDRIEPDETVTDWLVQGPNIDRLEPDDRQKALSDIASIATCLRKLRVNLMGMSPKKGLLRGFNHGIWARLEQAAAFITKNDQEHLQLAWWELQMALEASLKALALAKTGEFRRRHGIIDLFAAITGETDFAFDVDRFQVWPSWREMNEMRYGRGRSVNRLATVEAYGLVLELAEAATKAMVVWRFGQFRIEVRKAPWLEATSSS